MPTAQLPTLLAPKVKLIDDDGRMNRDWYSFFASRLKLLGRGEVTLDDLALLITTLQGDVATLTTLVNQNMRDVEVHLAFAE